MKRVFLFALPCLLFSACETGSTESHSTGNNSRKIEVTKNPTSTGYNDDSAALKGVYFGTSEKEFNRQKEVFQAPLKLKEPEVYKGRAVAFYRLGNYRFTAISGSFHKGKLYQVRLQGPAVNYDDYSLVMPEQYAALVAMLTERYGSPTVDNGLPAWTDIDKGFTNTPVRWDVGNKQVSIKVTNEGLKYYLDLDVSLPAIAKHVKEESEAKEKAAASSGSGAL